MMAEYPGTQINQLLQRYHSWRSGAAGADIHLGEVYVDISPVFAARYLFHVILIQQNRPLLAYFVRVCAGISRPSSLS
jgi:hypothetical protein